MSENHISRLFPFFYIVTERAVLGQINRKLEPDYQVVRKAQSNNRSLSFTLSAYCRLDTYQNLILDTYVDLESLGLDLGVLPKEEARRHRPAAA